MIANKLKHYRVRSDMRLDLHLDQSQFVASSFSSFVSLGSGLCSIHFQQSPIPLQLRLQFRLGGHDYLVFAGEQLGFVRQQRVLGDGRVAL
jgi:hypothetical protein